MSEARKLNHTTSARSARSGSKKNSATAAGRGAKAKRGNAAPKKPSKAKPKQNSAGRKSATGGKKGVSSRPAVKKKTVSNRSGAKSGASSRKGSSSTGSGSRAVSRSVSKVQPNPVANARHSRGNDGAYRKSGSTGRTRQEDRRDARRGSGGDLFMEARKAGRSGGSGKRPPRRGHAAQGMLNACLLIGIGVLIALGVRQQAAYADFTQMREVVDRQTFYKGTTVEGVDVSNMTLADAMDYWGERVEPRYANRTVTLDDGQTVTSGQLGYSSDYASVLSAAWSAGRNGSLEERYRMASNRNENPVAYSITRVDFDKDALTRYVQSVADAVNRPVREAEIESFDAQTYEFVLSEAQAGKQLDAQALAESIVAAIRAGGGNVTMEIETLAPELSTTEVAAGYGLIDYAITNASSSSRARLNNIKLAMSIINGTCVHPGEVFSFNQVVGERTTARGYKKATAYSGGDVTEQVGGGICQVSTTLFNAAVKADMEIVERHNHSLTVGYVDKGKDATVNWGNQDFKFRNTSDDDIYICCYLTDDKRVRFGIFGKLLPNGETITLDAVTTETVKFETQYQPSPLLAKGQTYLLEPGRNGYKAEAYKVRWDAQGNQISRELLCKSVYKEKDEIIQYGT